MAIKLHEIYQCEICGNVVATVYGSAGTLVCCNQDMNKLDEQSAEMKLEKHVPMIEVDGKKVTVTVGSTIHPMTEEHLIEWIEILTDDGKSYRQFLKAGDEPIAVFYVKSKVVSAREHCNLHGLWVNNN